MIRSLRLARTIAFCCAASVAAAAAPQDILYLRANFSDKSIGGGANGGDISDATWLGRLAAINSYAEAYWKFNSYRQITAFTPQFSDVYTIGPVSAYNTNTAESIRSAMRNAAASTGWDLSQFDQVVYSFPSVANLGGGALGRPGDIWMPSADPWAPGFTHEYGHALGVGHASSFEGANGAVYPGAHREGRDGLWMMGSESGVTPLAGRPERAPINLPMRHRMGFVDEALVTRIGAPQADILRLHAFDLPDLDGFATKGRSVAAVFRHDNREWWVSFAPTLAQRWAGDGGQVWADGVIVHELAGAVTRVLDFTPGSRGGIGNNEDWIDTRDGALRVGQSYTFPGSSLRLAPLEVGVSADGTPWIDVSIGNPSAVGDFNYDGVVDAADYTVWRDTDGQRGAGLAADGNRDGLVDFRDYNYFRIFYGHNRRGDPPADGLAVPEPTSTAVAVTFICLFGSAFHRPK